METGRRQKQEAILHKAAYHQENYEAVADSLDLETAVVEIVEEESIEDGMGHLEHRQEAGGKQFVVEHRALENMLQAAHLDDR